MTRQKALLALDPRRRREQRAYVAERVDILHEAGDRLWAALTDSQVTRFLARGIRVQVRERADLLELPAIVFDPLERDPAPPADLAATPTHDLAPYLVQFVAPPGPSWLRAIEDAGGAYVQGVPVHGAAFRMTADVAVAAAAKDFVRWVGPYHPAYALHYILAGREEPFDASTLPHLRVVAERLPSADGGNVEVRSLEGADLDSYREAVEAAGAEVRGFSDNGLVVSVDQSTLLGVLRVPDTFAAEPYAPPEPQVAHGRIIAGLRGASGVGGLPATVELDGAGEIVGVIDTGLDTGDTADLHAGLGARVLEIRHRLSPGDPVPDPQPGSNRAHGTHVTGNIAGDGTANSGASGSASAEHPIGVAPACHIFFQGPVTGGWEMSTARSMLVAHRAGARIHNNSWETRPRLGPRQSWNLYLSVSRAIDRYCATCPDDLVVFSAGNLERDVQGGPNGGPDGTLDQDRLAPEPCAKNALVVGATESLRDGEGDPRSYRTAASGRFEHNAWDELAGRPDGTYSMSDDADQVALFSCRGRVRSLRIGRIRPDLAAPGTNILSLRPQGWATPDDQPWRDPDHHADRYYFASGTSYAAPQVAGAAALARQYYRAHHGQLRRPATLDATPPWAQDVGFVDRPAICAHPDGVVVAWVPPTSSPDQNEIVAARLSAEQLQPVDPKSWRLAAEVGRQPAPALARHGDAVLLLHRQRDDGVRLRRFRPDLSPDGNFGTDGARSVTDEASQDPARPPALVVAGDHVGVAWTEDADTTLRFRRYDAATGAPLDDDPVSLGAATSTSTQPYLLHDGDRYAAVWVAGDGPSRLCLRLIDEGGEPVGTQPVVLAEEAEGEGTIHDPHLLWDERRHGFVVIWCRVRDARTQMLVRFLDAAGEPFTEPHAILPLPPGTAARRPVLAIRPVAGYVLLWEDDARHGRFEACLTFLDAAGEPIPGLPPRDPADPLCRPLVRLSDGSDDAAGGFVAVVDAHGATTVATQSEDGSGRRRVDAVGVTPEGAFRQTADRGRPLVHSGRYVPHTMGIYEPRQSPYGAVAATWAGGGYFHLRDGPEAGVAALVKTTADGPADAAYGDDGVLTVESGLHADRPALHWTPGRLVLVMLGGLGTDVVVRAFDQDGEALPGWWPQRLEGGAHPAVSPQVGHFEHLATFELGQEPPPTLAVVYGTAHGGQLPDTIRYARLDPELGRITRTDLVTLGAGHSGLGTARHGWFHVLPGEGSVIAAWHELHGETSRVLVNRFSDGGEPHRPAPLVVADAHGASLHAAIAPRPVGVTGPTSVDREYAVAWEFHPPGGGPAEIRFSRLDDGGEVMDDPPPPAPPRRDVRVIHPGTPGWPQDMDAVEPQLLCTFTGEPATDPDTGSQNPWHHWSPGFGLAWISQSRDGGPRLLHFTAVDENGRRLKLPLPPPHGPAGSHDIAPIVTLSDPTADVRDFQLLWNGRTFRLVWTEDHDGRVHHRQAVVTRHGSQTVYDQPSAALLRATLQNGATNLRHTELPNLADGYGWGRLNLRQALSPAPPVTFEVRDGDTVGPGGRARYRFSLPARTRQLRIMLAWTDPAGPELTRVLHLRVVAPGDGGAGREYHGNDWLSGKHRSRVVGPAAVPWQDIHNSEQVVIEDPPPGVYEVEVLGDEVPLTLEAQLPAAPFALVFTGSGREKRFAAPADLGNGLPEVGGRDAVTFPLASFPIVEEPEDGIDYTAPVDPRRKVDLPEVPLIEVGHRLNERLSNDFAVWQLAARTLDRSGKVRYARIDPRLVDALQRMRDHLAAPIEVRSGYRYPALNKCVGRDSEGKCIEGAVYSQHLMGRGADIPRAPGVGPLELADAALRVLGPEIGLARAKHTIHIDVRGYRANWPWKLDARAYREFVRWIDQRWAEITAERGETVHYPRTSLPIVEEPQDGIDYSDPVDPGTLDPVPLVEVRNRLGERLSRDFWVRELAARRLDGEDRVGYARIDPRLVDALQHIRDRLQAPVFVTSGYRYSALDAHQQRCRGSEQQHLTGRAADIRSRGVSPSDLAKTAVSALSATEYADVGMGLLSDGLHIDVRGHGVMWTDVDAPESGGVFEERAEEWRAEQTRTTPFAQAGGVVLFDVSPRTLLRGYHEAYSNTSQAIEPAVQPIERPPRDCGRDLGPQWGPIQEQINLVKHQMEAAPAGRRVVDAVLWPRCRGTPASSAADIAVPAGTGVRSPVSGTVTAAGPYEYGPITDWRVRIVPAEARDRVVVVLHLQHIRVKVGDRVVAGQTEIASRAHLLPWPGSIQIEHYVGRSPHVHIEVRPR